MPAQKVAPAAGAAACIAAAVALCVPITAGFEGFRPRPYWDPAHIRTYCNGETEHVVERVYTREECGMLLRSRQERDYAPAVLRCAPAIATRREIFAASIDAAYNAGTGAFCRSPMARAFNVQRWAQGCHAFFGWYDTARVNGVPKKLPGLVRRRAAERDLCLKGV